MNQRTARLLRFGCETRAEHRRRKRAWRRVPERRRAELRRNLDRARARAFGELEDMTNHHLTETHG